MKLDSIKKHFFYYLSGLNSLEEFKVWLFHDKNIENQLGEEDYLNLVSLNFNNRDLKSKIKEFIAKKFDWNEYLDWNRIREENEMDKISQSTMHIDLGNIKSYEELHRLFKFKLKFPDFYGNNWNAFWDAITGLVAMPKVLVIENWDQFSRRLKNESEAIEKIINDYNKLEYIDGKIEIISRDD